MTIIVSTIKEWLAIRKTLAGKSIGFAPTMGNLHQGHLSLYRHAKQENDITVASIFVNPKQFNQQSDFDLYPRTIEADIDLLRQTGVDYVLIPNADEIYHDQYEIQVQDRGLSTLLEGEHRPGHFTGVLTVVLKLLNIVGASKAYFGKKDYQQYLLIQKMVSALFLPTEIIGVDTVRAEDGLPLSSRNNRLTPEQREHAKHFSACLKAAATVEEAIEKLTALGFKVDYVAEEWGRRLAAVWVGEVRLLDNIAV